MDRIREYFQQYGGFDGEGNPVGVLRRDGRIKEQTAEEFAAMQEAFARLRRGEVAEDTDEDARREQLRARVIDDIIIPNL